VIVRLKGELNPELTLREREVALLVCRGLSRKEIGIALDMCYNTVRNHVTAIFAKKKVTNKIQLLLVLTKDKTYRAIILGEEDADLSAVS
jgi:DNA-binding NarL/FixJ family response regulator